MLPHLSRQAVLSAILALSAALAIACGSATQTVGGGSDDPQDSTSEEITSLPGWRTDLTIRSVDLDEIVRGQIKDGIPALDGAKFDSIARADEDLIDREPVIAVEINGDARAYPLGILTRHEISNDVIGGVPVAVTFCPLCNSAIAFEREFGGVVYNFGVSGFLRNSDLIMFDRQTETWWQQFTGEAIVGELTGTLLEVVPSSIISWTDFKAAFPDGQVLSRDTGFGRDYDFNPYAGYDSDEDPFLLLSEPDTRLSPIERVVAVELNDEPVAYPFTLLQELRIVEDTVGGESIVVFHKPGTASALDVTTIAEGRDIGASGVFRPEVAGQALTFRIDGDDFVDNETGSTWSILGKATAGPLAGEELAPVVHGDHFWFAWAAFNPDTRIFEG